MWEYLILPPASNRAHSASYATLPYTVGLQLRSSRCIRRVIGGKSPMHFPWGVRMDERYALISTIDIEKQRPTHRGGRCHSSRFRYDPQVLPIARCSVAA